MALGDRPTPRATIEKPERFEARLSREQKQVLLKAAAHAGQSLTQFVISSAQRAAEQTIREHEVITLSVRDSQALLATLRNPGPTPPKLVEAAQRYKAFMGES